MRRLLLLAAVAALLAGLPGGVRAEAYRLDPSPRTHGHPMLLYLRSDSIIPDAHARCLRFIEAQMERTLTRWHSGLLWDRDEVRGYMLATINNAVAIDWGVLARQRYVRWRTELTGQIPMLEQRLAEARRAADAIRRPAPDDSRRLAMYAAQADLMLAEGELDMIAMTLRYVDCALANDLAPTVAE